MEKFFEQYTPDQVNMLLEEALERYDAEAYRQGLITTPPQSSGRRMSKAEQREAKNEEVLKRVFGDHPEDPDGWF